jgi:hypothetical protein
MSRRRKILIVAGIVLGVAILIPVIRHYQLRFAVANYVAELKAKGEPMDLAQVIPPPVPPEQNGAWLITNALVQFAEIKNYTNSMILKNPPFAMGKAIPNKQTINWQQSLIHNSDGRWPTNTWEDLGAQLDERKSELAQLRSLIDRPVLDFNLNYDISYNQQYYRGLRLERLEQFKIAAQWLVTSSLYNLHQGKSADACTDVRALLAMVKGEADERVEISQLVRIAIAQIGVGATWNVLQATNVSDEDLEKLQQDWQSLGFVSPLNNAFLFERLKTLQLVGELQHSPTNLDAQVEWSMAGKTEYQYKRTANGTYVLDDERSFFQKMKDGISTKWDDFQWRWFWSYKDEIRGLQMWRIMIDGTQMLKINNSFQSVQSFFTTNFSQLGFDSAKDDPYAFFSRDADQLAALRKAANVEIARNIVITAIALKRYELRHHQLPATLDQLTPDLLQTVPIDCMDGQPLRYRPNVDGTFLLYSVGTDGKDDGGNPSLQKNINYAGSNFHWQNDHALDWVWPQPATEEEIQAYYKKLSAQKN